MKRTHTCGELTSKDVGKEVTLQGWVNTRRDHGGVVFIDLRDRYGLTQVVFDPSEFKKVHEKAHRLRREFVLQTTGKVRPRPEGTVNPKMHTGEIEVLSSEIEILNEAKTPPFEIDDRVDISEDSRLTYRYLDIRKPGMQQNLLMRHRAAKTVRDFLDKENFAEIETPMLAKSTPEGARDYLVPSRVHPGKFFALPQSPQLFKQLLMVSGMDRYFQIVKCFRDEDLRADRQPEFTQIDMEMSFVEEEDIYDICERMMKEIWKKTLDIDIKTPFPRITYDEAMDRYGSDKPDTRFGLELIDVGDIVKDSDFGVFKKVLENKGRVKCINAKGCARFSRKDIDDLTEYAAIYGAKGLAWMKMQDKLESSIVKFFPEAVQKKLVEKTGVKKGDMLFFVADKPSIVADALGNLRLELARRLDMIPKDVFKFIWVVDFPVFEWDEDEGRHTAIHHPFTSPKDDSLELLDKEPGKAKAKAYDLTVNGVELGGGSIRIHRRDVQEKVFRALGISDDEAKQKFGFLLNAFEYGAPPHGGIAFGFDRLIAILTGNESIREVIAFPKNKACQSLMDSAPSKVSEKQYKELHLQSTVLKKKK